VERLAAEAGYGAAVDASAIPRLARAGARRSPSGLGAGGKKELLILPQRRALLPLHDLHAQADKDRDCTHFCSSPDLFLPAWRSLRIAMDDYFS
jgi:hypothetical protein